MPVRFLRVGCRAAFAAFGLGTLACGGNMMSGPSMVPGMRVTAGTTSLMSVSPSGSTSGVPVNTSLTMRFGHAMAPGMEQFVDLHVGDPSGPTVPPSCGWSPDRTLLTCVPETPLRPRTTYALHLGGGMMDADDHVVDIGEHGTPMGGQWLYPNMMSGHGGMPWGRMGSGWRNPNGSYGMFFTFTTA
jgi:hypothetical protein